MTTAAPQALRDLAARADAAGLGLLAATLTQIAGLDLAPAECRRWADALGREQVTATGEHAAILAAAVAVLLGGDS